MTRMVATEIESLLKDYGYHVIVREIIEDTLLGGKVRSSLLHAVNQKIQSILIVRIGNDGYTRIRFTIPIDNISMDTIALKLEEQNFNVDITENNIEVFKRVTIHELVDTLKHLLSTVLNY